MMVVAAVYKYIVGIYHVYFYHQVVGPLPADYTGHMITRSVAAVMCTLVAQIYNQFNIS